MKAIALLRGINVGGHKIIPMAKLKAIFESAGFKNVVTFIQSGNVLFDATATDVEALRTKVEKMLVDALGYDVPAIIRSANEMKKIVAKNPFADEHVEKKTKYYYKRSVEMLRLGKGLKIAVPASLFLWTLIFVIIF